MDLSPTISSAETISAHLRMILRGVLAVLGMWRLDDPQKIVIYGRISRAIGRIERMLVRFQAGRLRPVVLRDAVAGTRVRVAGRGPALPRRFGWLVIAGGHQAAGFGCQLQTVMAMPAMAELLAQSAQARRVLRPWCRALAIELPWTVSRPTAEPREAKPRVRKPRPKPEPFKIPLPRGMLTWARREGFGKLS